MTTTRTSDLDTAVGQLLDALIENGTVTLDSIELDDGKRGIERLMTTLHTQARRRGIGVEVRQREGGEPCLFLRQP